MSLYLAESILPPNLRSRDAVEEAVKAVSERIREAGGVLVEVQVSNDLTRAFLILDAPDQGKAKDVLNQGGVPVTLLKKVRLVGADLRRVLDEPAPVRYVVEWNLPEGLTMDAYLERKRKNSVHYAEVPEVSFERTYVCEDMTKCICFYNAPDQEAVKRARQAVSAPVDAITETIGVDLRGGTP